MIENNRVEFNIKERNDGINVGKDVGKDDGKNEVKLSKNQEEILKEISKNKNTTQRELAILLKVTERTIERNTAILQEKGFLKRIGPSFGGHWEVIK